jgi:MFS family permease
VAGNIWRIGGFRNLWISQSVSLVGTQITLLAFPLLALLLLDASALQVSLLSTVEFLPVLLLGLPAGAWVDRLAKRPVLILTDLARAGALLAIPAAYLFDALTLPLLYAVAFVIGLGTLFFDVAQLSYLPALVDEDRLVDANGKLEASRSVAQLAGPGLGGFLVQLLGGPVAIVVDAVSYLVSAGFLTRIKGTDTPAGPVQRVGLRREIGDGLRFVLGHPLLRPIVISAAAAELAFAAVLALQVPYAVDTLGLDAGVLGLAIAVGNAGGLLGAFGCGWIARRFPTGPAMIASIAVFSLGAALVPLAGGAIGFAAALFVVYAGVVVFNVLQVTVCQTATPSHLLGRMNATLRFLTWGMVPVGAALGGLLVEPLGMRGVLWLAAAVTAASILPPLFSRVRALSTTSPATEPTETERTNS